MSYSEWLKNEGAIIYLGIASFLGVFLIDQFILHTLLGHAIPALEPITYETWLAPTYYYLTKAVLVWLGVTVTYFALRNKMVSNLVLSAAAGFVGSNLFNLYYYFVRPPLTFEAIVYIGVFHFLAAFVFTYFAVGAVRKA